MIIKEKYEFKYKKFKTSWDKFRVPTYTYNFKILDVTENIYYRFCIDEDDFEEHFESNELKFIDYYITKEIKTKK